MSSKTFTKDNEWGRDNQAKANTFVAHLTSYLLPSVLLEE